jgi:site-specific DNA-methyltransferase (adenine-specific)
MYQLYLGDCIEQMRKLPDNSVDSIVTDPPYELGFMGKSWDSTGIAYSVKMWDECLRVLKHGGHLLAFSGSRTYHRMAVAIEDAGFEIRDQIMWVYGSGFPKSHNISKAIDKMAGAEREVIGQKMHARKGVAIAEERTTVGAGAYGESRLGDITISATDEAKQWDGWGTALKPAHEPIVLARKPFPKGYTVVQNVLEFGVGGINIDGSRIPHLDEADRASATPQGRVTSNTMAGAVPDVDDIGRKELDRPDTSKGRYPSNFIHDGSNEATELLGDSARFFYCPKTSKKDRNEGLDNFEERQSVGGGGGIGDYLDDVNSASGKFGSEKAPSKNNHPTVKPTELMRYLVRMVTPPNGTVLDPFTGSGSTGKASVLEGFNFIGCELDPDYIAIAEARIKHGLESQESTLF